MMSKTTKYATRNVIKLKKLSVLALMSSNIVLFKNATASLEIS